MKRNKIFNFLCCLFCLYGCSDCDNAELIDGGKGDAHEDYQIGVDAYARDREFIKACCNMSGMTDDFDEKSNLPPKKIVRDHENDIIGYFYVNNNIVFNQLFYRLAIMKIKFKLLVEKLAIDQHEVDVDGAFNIAKDAIVKILDELPSPGDDGSRNQAIYRKMGELDDTIAENVHKQLIPTIIEKIRRSRILPTLDNDLKEYEGCPTIGVESILLSELFADHADFQNELIERIKKLDSKLTS